MTWLLALGGAKVMLAARRKSEFQAIRARIVGELEDMGYSGAGRRVRIMPGMQWCNSKPWRRP